ncbi:hypothetical protein GCM10027614_45110 [Micromonospora vulcania]
MTSSFQLIAPGMLNTSAPGIASGCQTLNVAPAGSAKTAIRPRSKTSNGGTTTCPPARSTRPATSSASSVARYVDQIGTWSGIAGGPAPATERPSSRKTV